MKRALHIRALQFSFPFLTEEAMRLYRYLTNPPIWSEASHWVQAAHNWFSIFGAAGYAWATILQTRSGIVGLQLHWGPTINSYSLYGWVLRCCKRYKSISNTVIYLVYIYMYIYMCSDGWSLPPLHTQNLWWYWQRIPSRTGLLISTSQKLASPTSCHIMFHPTGMGLAVIWNNSF